MEIEWDEAKRRLNIQKHGLDFVDAVAVFQGEHVLSPARQAGLEVRFAVTGRLDGRYVTIIATQRGGNIRVISMRRARNHERSGHQALYGG